MSDFIPKQKKNIPVELIDDAFDNAATGVEVWYIKDGKMIMHGTIIPLPIGKDGNRTTSNYTHENTRRSCIGKDAHAAVTAFINARGLNPDDYLGPSRNYWNDYYCFIASEEDITKNVLAAYVSDRVRAIKNVRPVPSKE